MENFEAECQEKVCNVQQALEVELNSLREHVRECTITTLLLKVYFVSI